MYLVTYRIYPVSYLPTLGISCLGVIFFLKFWDGCLYSPTLIRSVLAAGLGWVGLFFEKKHGHIVGCRLYCTLQAGFVYNP